METGHNHTYKFCMEYCLQISCKYGGLEKLWCFVWQI